MAKKRSPYAAALLMQRQQRDQDVRHHARIFQMDLVTIALGRMGWRESKFRELDKVLSQVVEEYCTEILEDSKNDTELWYSKETIDREIKQYVGKMFVPYDERYK